MPASIAMRKFDVSVESWSFLRGMPGMVPMSDFSELGGETEAPVPHGKGSGMCGFSL